MNWGVSSTSDLKFTTKKRAIGSLGVVNKLEGASCHTIEIDGGCFNDSKTVVKFPYEPYSIQHDFVQKLVQTLEAGGNALLESPTGTGKTACLLCGSLSWQQQYAQSIQMSEVHQIPNSGSSKRQKMEGIGGRAENIKSSSAPKIFYSSRTHSQLSQAIGELKRVNFPDIKAVVIGSRDQLCIHPEVKQENNATVKTHLCRQKVKTRTCHFYNNYEKLKESKETLILEQKDIIIICLSVKYGNRINQTNLPEK